MKMRLLKLLIIIYGDNYMCICVFKRTYHGMHIHMCLFSMIKIRLISYLHTCNDSQTIWVFVTFYESILGRKAQKPKKNSLPMLCDACGTLTPLARMKSCKIFLKPSIAWKSIEKWNERGMDEYSIMKTSEKKSN